MQVHVEPGPGLDWHHRDLKHLLFGHLTWQAATVTCPHAPKAATDCRCSRSSDFGITRLHGGWSSAVCWANRKAWRGNGCYPRMKPHTQGSPIRKWEIRAAVHASIRHGPAATRTHTALSFLRAWQHTEATNYFICCSFVCIFFQWKRKSPNKSKSVKTLLP